MTTPVLDMAIPTRRSNSPDIIDVDLLDDEEITASQRPFQRRRHDSIIEIEEIIELPGPQSGGSPSHYRSPPPPPQSHVVPPVPPLPRHMRGMSSFPIRRRAPHQSQPGVVRPNSQPFAFEANFGDAQPSTPTVTAAVPSHHVPAMGFGGALLAIHGQNAGDEDARRALNRRISGLQNRIRHIPAFAQATDYFASRLSVIADHLGRLQGDLGDFPHIYDSAFNEDDLPLEFTRTFLQDGVDQMESAMSAAFAKKFKYKPTFTHPGKIPTDFTHDFCPPNGSTIHDLIAVGPSSSASSGSSSVDTILVCAQCLDPLVIGGGPDTSAANRRLWGLRCGHILDGKCIEKLFKPEDAVEQPFPTPANDDSGKISTPSPTGKGKGKEVALMQVPAQGSNEGSVAMPAPTRRLRSGRTVPTMNGIHHHGRTSRPRKGKGKMRGPVIERGHEWRCPVSGCGRTHRSVLLDGQWKMEETAGAIQMYV